MRPPRARVSKILRAVPRATEEDLSIKIGRGRAAASDRQGACNRRMRTGTSIPIDDRRRELRLRMIRYVERRSDIVLRERGRRNRTSRARCIYDPRSTRGVSPLNLILAFHLDYVLKQLRHARCPKRASRAPDDVGFGAPWMLLRHHRRSVCGHLRKGCDGSVLVDRPNAGRSNGAVTHYDLATAAGQVPLKPYGASTT